MKDRKEYMRELMAKRRANKTANISVEVLAKTVSISNKVVSTFKRQDIDQEIFKGVGRGVPVSGYVLVSKDSENSENIVVSEKDWLARLSNICSHGFNGWSCKACL